MNFQVPDRIHIAPLGYEYDRVLEPAEDYKADRVYLVDHDEAEENRPEYHEKLRESLRKADIEVFTVTCDIFDLYAMLGQIAELIIKNKENQVYVNLSTGSKVSAIAGMIACMVTRETVEVTPFYVRASGYSSEEDESQQEKDVPVSHGVEAVSMLPTYPIDGPTRDEIVMLQYISEHGAPSKKELIRYARREVGAIRRNSEEKDISVNSDPQMGEYRLLDNYVLNPLLEKQCIRVSEVGRTKEVEITEEGENTLRAFDYLID